MSYLAEVLKDGPVTYWRMSPTRRRWWQRHTARLVAWAPRRGDWLIGSMDDRAMQRIASAIRVTPTIHAITGEVAP